MTWIDESKRMEMAGGGYYFYKWKGPTARGERPHMWDPNKYCMNHIKASLLWKLEESTMNKSIQNKGDIHRHTSSSLLVLKAFWDQASRSQIFSMLELWFVGP